MTDPELMQSIFQKYNSQITVLCEGTGISPALVAGLIANESGGDVAAKRFEGAVLVDLWNVLVGRQSTYGSIGRADLEKYLTRDADLYTGTNAAADLSDMCGRLDALATSWGLTQIMGYELFDVTMQLPTPGKLATITGSLSTTLLMLQSFVRRFALDLSTPGGMADLFGCWNTGRPGGKTYDPQYRTKGLSRAAIYNGIIAAGAAGGEVRQA